MEAEVSYTDQHGITTSLSLSADPSALIQLYEGQESESSVSYLAETFESCLREMPKELLRAHSELCRDLLGASCRVLQEKLNSVEDQ